MRISDWSSDVCSSDLIDAVEIDADAGIDRGEEVVLADAADEDDCGVAGARIAGRGVEGQAWDRLRDGRDIRRAFLLERGTGDCGHRHGRVLQRFRTAARCHHDVAYALAGRSEEHTSELQSLMRSSYAVFCLKKKKKKRIIILAHKTKLNE